MEPVRIKRKKRRQAIGASFVFQDFKECAEEESGGPLVKVNAPIGAPAYFERIGKSEGANDQNQKKKQDEQSSRDSSKDDEKPVTQESLGEAVSAFSHDPNSQVHGLSAKIEGQGPGLRVTLKDGYGGVVRQLTGEEFMKLKTAAQGLTRGRLLDKKL